MPENVRADCVWESYSFHGFLPNSISAAPKLVDVTHPQAAAPSGFATLWGMNHLRIRKVDDFDPFESSEKTLLLEIIPDAKQTTAFWAAWDRMSV